jgi:hypothetical protein
MLAHVDQPDIDRIATRHQSVPDSSPRLYRHLNRCELFLRRLIEAELRLALVGLAGQNNARTTDRPASV